MVTPLNPMFSHMAHPIKSNLNTFFNAESSLNFFQKET